MKPALIPGLFMLLAVFSCVRTLAAPQPESSFEQPQLVIYTVYSDELSEALLKEFRQRTAIPVHVEKGTTIELLARLRSEAAVPRADILWGVVSDALEQDPGLFVPYVTEAAMFIPAAVRDHKDRWTAFQIIPAVSHESPYGDDDAAAESRQKDRPLLVESVALLHGAPHAEAGRQFIEFLVSKDVQSLISAVWQRLPVRQDVRLPDQIP